MQRLIFLIITIVTLCISLCSCESQHFYKEKKEVSAEDVSSEDNQVLKEVSRRVIVKDSEGNDKEEKKYGEDGKLQYYARISKIKETDNSNGEKKEVEFDIYSDIAGQNKIGRAIYTYDKAKKTKLMELFNNGEDVAAQAEYFEYLDEEFKLYTKYCQYSPAENNKIIYYRTADFYNNTHDFKEEIDYVSDGFTWNPETNEPNDSLEILEKVVCEYNNISIPDTDNKQHQWIREIREVNSYNVESGEKMTQRKFQYDFLWNENISKYNHVQQNAFELDDANNIISVNDIVIRSFQKYGESNQLKRKSWLSAECETKYYYEYEYALMPNNGSEYYLTSKKLVDISEGTKLVKNENRNRYYYNDNEELVFEEIKLEADSSRNIGKLNDLGLSLIPKRYSRSR